MEKSWDVVIIGAGMSGLAAGIRLAHFGRRVIILEQCDRLGGLNTWFRREGHIFETGLHAVTNFAARDDRRAPLNRLLRQLRLDRDQLGFCPQRGSVVRFGDTELRLGNGLSLLEREIDAGFPRDRDGFRALVERILAEDCYSLHPRSLSTRQVLREHLSEPLLAEMLLMPVLFYGGAQAHDMEFAQFCVLFRSCLCEGLWRPAGGIRALLSILETRYMEAGGELRLNTPANRIELDDAYARRVGIADGEAFDTKAVLSTAGYAETLRLCSPPPEGAEAWPAGRMSFVEAVFVLDQPASELGFRETVRFENSGPTLRFDPPEQLVDTHSRVLCAPDNFEGSDAPHAIRSTRLANHRLWFGLDADAYAAAKRRVLQQEAEALERSFPGASGRTVCTDLFTPRTIRRFTGHINGAVYGSPRKQRDGTTPVANLFVAGTDQGFLGIVGALMSGVSIANAHLVT